jgi:hypothetical protein
MNVSKGDAVTYMALVTAAVLQAGEPWRKEAAVPPESHPILSSAVWAYVPLALLTLVALIWLIKQFPMIGRISQPQKEVLSSRFDQIITAQAQPPLSKMIYLGQFHVDFGRFDNDYCFEFAIKAFNGTGQPVSVGQVRGAIRYFELMGTKTLEKEMLPSPTFLADRGKIDFDAYEEMFLVFDQRVPRAVALRMREVFEAGNTVGLDFATLAIPLTIKGSSSGKPLTLSLRRLFLRKTSGIAVK